MTQFWLRRFLEALLILASAVTYSFVTMGGLKYSTTIDGNSTFGLAILSYIFMPIFPPLALLAAIQGYVQVILRRRTPRIVEILLTDFAIIGILFVLCGVFFIGFDLPILKLITSMFWHLLFIEVNNLIFRTSLFKLSIFGLSITFLLILPLIISWFLTMLASTVYLYLQVTKFKVTRKSATLAFVLFQLSKFITILFFISPLAYFIKLGIVFSIMPIILAVFTPSLVFSPSLNIITYISMIWGGGSIVILSSLILGIALIFLSSFLPVKSEAFRILYYFVWHYCVPMLLWLLKFVVPFSFVGLFSRWAYTALLQSLVFLTNQSGLTISDVQSRDLLAKFALDYLYSKPIFSFSSFKFYGSIRRRAYILRVVANQIFLLGDLKLSNHVYECLWNFLQERRESAISSKVQLSLLYSAFDETFDEISQYYIRTKQHKSIDALYKEVEKLSEQGFVSQLTLLSSTMRLKLNFATYANRFQFSIVKLLTPNRIISHASALILFSSTPRRVRSPEDFNKIFIGMMRGDEQFEKQFAKNNATLVDDTLKPLITIFRTQEKIYAFASGNDLSLNLTQSEIESALTSVVQLKVLGILISYRNPFLNENRNLIPLCLLRNDPSYSLEVINKLLSISIDEGRNVDTAFLQCCAGKLLIDRGIIDDGIKILHTGISMYESIRSTIVSDHVGIGFGSSYLEYYDWAVDAAIKQNRIAEAFDYAEHSKARALLDLVSQKTSVTSTTNTSAVARAVIDHLKDIELSLMLLDLLVYQLPLFLRWLPAPVRLFLQRKFYSNKQERKQALIAHRSALISELESIDPASAALVTFKPLTWRTKASDTEKRISFKALWESQVISPAKAVLCIHIVHKLHASSATRDWKKVICFSLIQVDGRLTLHHHVIDTESTVAQIQNWCRAIPQEMGAGRRSQGLFPVSENLLFPLLSKLSNTCKDLIITANSDLQFMPWSALYYNEKLAIVDRFSLCITPSLSLLYSLNQRETARQTATPCNVLVAGIERYPSLADYLFWSGVEVSRVAQIYRTNFLKDREVDRQFAERFKQAEIIHYSGHANYSAKREANALKKTYLSLYNQYLSAAQILEGALEGSAAKVMILSACLTGQGDLTDSGSEILGLERALFQTGLSALVTTLWEVGDFSTALFMMKFHKTWHQTGNHLFTLSPSLRATQLWLRDLTWKQLKQEYPEIEQNVLDCTNTYQIMIERARDEQNKNALEEFGKQVQFYQQIAEELKANSTGMPFVHPRAWAAFQVKGLG